MTRTSEEQDDTPEGAVETLSRIEREVARRQSIGRQLYHVLVSEPAPARPLSSQRRQAGSDST